MKNQHQNYDDERVDLILDLFLKVIAIVFTSVGLVGTVIYFLK